MSKIMPKILMVVFFILFCMLSIFQFKGVIEVLIYLLNNPEGKRKVDIRQDLSKQISINSAVNAHSKLLEAGLLKIIRFSDSLDDYYALSKAGIIVAQKLSEIENKLKEVQETIKQNKNWFEFEFAVKKEAKENLEL